MTVFEIVIICLIQAFFLPILFFKIKNRTLSIFDFSFILILDTVLSLFLVYPSLFTYISGFFGIARGVDIFIYFSIIALFYIVFRIYFKMEKLKQDLTKLNREMSIRMMENKNPE